MYDIAVFGLYVLQTNSVPRQFFVFLGRLNINIPQRRFVMDTVH